MAYKIDEDLQKKLDALAELAAQGDSVQNLIKQAVESNADEIVEERVNNTIDDRLDKELKRLELASLKDLIQEVSENSLLEQSTRISELESRRITLSCAIKYKGHGADQQHEYNTSCPAGYDHIMNSNIYSMGREQQWQSLCCKAVFN